MRKRDRDAVLNRIADACAVNPGSPYVTVSMSRRQAEAIVAELRGARPDDKETTK